MSMLLPPQETPTRLLELYSRLSRWPDIQSPELEAHDAADRLLVDTFLPMSQKYGAPDRIVVLGEKYGAVSLALASLPEFSDTEILAVQESVTYRNALAANAAALGLSSRVETADLAAVSSPQAPTERTWWAGLVPRSHGVVHQWAHLAALTPGMELLLLAGRLKHLSLGLNTALEDSFLHVSASKSRQKSRLLLGSTPKPGLAPKDFLESAMHEVGFSIPLHLRAVPGTFGGTRLDPGTRLLLPELAQLIVDSRPSRLVDLGCGNGSISSFAALLDSDLQVTATDTALAAVESTVLSAQANGVDARVRVLLDDALSTWPDASEDLIVLNPPFHVGNTVSEDIAYKLFDAAGRVLRPGGKLLCVWNSPRTYMGALRRGIGPTRVVARNAKFTVSISER